MAKPGNKNALGNKGNTTKRTTFKKEYIEQGERLSLLGLTDVEMGAFFGVHENTINRWKNEHPEFMVALKSGKEDADAKVVKSLYKRAIGYTSKEVVTASHQGIITDIKVVDKYIPPDTTAAIFWLKNRQSKRWRDKVEQEHTGSLKLNISDTKFAIKTKGK